MPAFESGTEWLRGQGSAADVVLSSRVRLARNLAGFPFMTRATRADRLQILALCRDRVLDAGLAKQVMWVSLHEAPPVERTLLVERHLISQQHARGKQSTGVGGQEEPRGVAVSLPDERLSIMVNEEDHLRLQVIRSGLALDAALADVDAADDRIESRLDYAYSPRFGYLTACPTNVGTGVRFSVMVHLPGLKMSGDLDKAKQAATDMSLAVRGFYGEGSEATGDFYQISNQTTLGKSEAVLLHELQHEILPRVIEYERASRRGLAARRRTALEDQVNRALGTLTHARLLSAEEALNLLSQVRLGVVMELIPGVELATVHQLMLLSQPAHLQKVLGREMNQDERRSARAGLIRSRLTATGPKAPP